jgi:hypothetical protein
MGKRFPLTRWGTSGPSIHYIAADGGAGYLKLSGRQRRGGGWDGQDGDEEDGQRGRAQFLHNFLHTCMRPSGY